MALRNHNQKPQFSLKIVHAFLVILCCLGAPLSAILASGGVKTASAATEFYPSNPFQSAAFDFKYFTQESFRAAQSAGRQFSEGVAAAKNEVFPYASALAAESGRRVAAAWATAAAGTMNFTEKSAMKIKDGADDSAAAVFGMIGNSVERTAGLGNSVAATLAQGIYFTGNTAAENVGGAGLAASESLINGFDFAKDLANGGLRRAKVFAQAGICFAETSANGVSDGISAAGAAIVAEIGNASDKFTVAAIGAAGGAAANLAAAANSIARTACAGAGWTAAKSSQAAAAVFANVENSAEQTAALGACAVNLSAQGIYLTGSGAIAVADNLTASGFSAARAFGRGYADSARDFNSSFNDLGGTAGIAASIVAGETGINIRKAEFAAKQTAAAGKEFAVTSAKLGQASLFSFFDRAKNNIRGTVRRWLGTEQIINQMGDFQLSINEIKEKQQDIDSISDQTPPAASRSEESDQIIEINANLPASDYSRGNVQPVKEVQTIHTVTNTNFIVDEETKAKVNQLLRQLDSDRPNFSVGQVVSFPSKLYGELLNIAAGKFTIDNEGNARAAGNLIVQGNFTVSGAQTYSGAGAFTASTTAAVLTAIQNGSGFALLADNVAIKGSAVSSQSGDLEFGAESGKIKAAAGNVFYTEGGNPIRAAGEEILRGSAPIFGFDLPARTASTSFVPVSRAVALETLSLPEPMAGTTRVYRLSIRYSNASASTTAENFSLGIYDLGAATTTSELKISYSSTGDLDEGAVYLTEPVTIPAAPGAKWRVEAKTNPGIIIQIFQINLQAYDRIR